MKYLIIAALLLAACGGEDADPLTDTTSRTGAATTTTPASATTTASRGGGSSNLPIADKEFVVNAGMAGLAEVRMGELALRKSEGEDVRAFATKMIADHGKTNDELRALAIVKGLAVPGELEGSSEEALEHLESVGADFDSVYLQHMVADHRKAVADFESAATAVQDADLRAYAENTLPVLREHLQVAERLLRK